MSQNESGRVSVAAIRGLITDALTAAGLPREDAAKCAALMGEADLTGADAHGVFRLPQYVRRLKAGGFNKRPSITVTRSAPEPATSTSRRRPTWCGSATASTVCCGRR